MTKDDSIDLRAPALIKRPQRGALSEFWLHFRLLVWKNLLVMRRNFKSTLFQILCPVLICCVLAFFQHLSTVVQQQSLDLNPPITKIGKVPKCSNADCISIGYGLIGDPTLTIPEWVNYTLISVSAQNDLVLGKDVQRLFFGKNSSDYMDYLADHPGVVQVGVLFCISEWEMIPGYKVPCDEFYFPFTGHGMFYAIVFNNSKLPSLVFADLKLAMPKDPVATALKVSIDTAIGRYLLSNPNMNVWHKDMSNVYNLTFDIETQDYPKTPLRFFQGQDVVASQGAFYFSITPLLSFIIVLTEIVREKELRLRQGLNVMGLSSTSYWLSWFLQSNIICFLITMSQMLSAFAFNFKFFLDTPFFILFPLFYFTTLALHMLAYLLSSLISSVKVANSAAYGLFLLAIVIQIFISNYLIILYLYDKELDKWVHDFRTFISYYPAFNFAKIYGDISRKSGNHLDVIEGRWVPGPGYTWDDLFKDSSGKLPNNDLYYAPSSFQTFIDLFKTVGIYIALTWYFDHVVQSNRGTNESLIFFLKPKYWRCCARCVKRKRRDVNLSVDNTSAEDDSRSEIAISTDKENEGNFDAVSTRKGRATVDDEKQRIISAINEDSDNKGIRIVNISKTYKKYPFGIKSKGDVKALSNVFLEIQDGELLSILGHNGAGKTTLLGVLTGLLSADDGEVFYFDYNIHEDIEEIRHLLGICPQFDILWNDLTAYEHLYMFAKIKGIPNNEIRTVVEQKLREVNLLNEINNLVRTFSGGMKRRLSVAMSMIGDPKIMILDEPTTGMDPKNRRAIWNLIQVMKKDRVILLTTHAMEEADALSDRIVVIVDGRLKCIGTSLFLKNNFGEGYRLTLTTEINNVERLRDLIKWMLPSSHVLDISAGNIVVSMSHSRISELNVFFKMMEGKDIGPDWDVDKQNEIRSMVKDWGLSHSTLEEVFMRVTGKKEQKHSLKEE